MTQVVHMTDCTLVYCQQFETLANISVLNDSLQIFNEAFPSHMTLTNLISAFNFWFLTTIRWMIRF